MVDNVSLNVYSQFIAIEILGALSWHSADEICPECNGTGKVGRWLCPKRMGRGFVWRCSAAEASAIYSFLFTVIFSGLFLFAYIVDAFYAGVNPWVRNVKEMQWSFNPMFSPWLFENDRRRWALYTTIVCSFFSVFLGLILFYTLTYKRITLENSLAGFFVGCSLLIFLAFSWYKGFWKPRTREKKSRYLPAEEVETEEEFYFPPKPA